MAALNGLRVLDLSRVLAGPLATMTLGDLGADVLKVERPGGDDTRQWGPPHDAQGQATYFQSVNRNKRSVVLDLRDPGDAATARELARTADVLVENFRPGVMERLGLDYETLRAENPRLVFCSITGFGATPAAAALPGYDLLVQALGGLMSVTGSPDGEPQKVGVALVDVVCGLQATAGILAALHARRETGVGQRVEVDLLSSLLSGLVNQASGYTVAGAVPSRMGNQHPSIAPYELLAAADGDLVLAVGNDRQFAALCGVLGLDPDPAWATNPGRVGDRDALRAALETRLRTRPVAEWVDALTAVGVPAGAVNDVAGAFALAERLGTEPVAEAGGTPLPRSPLRLSETPVQYRYGPPALGADEPRWLA